MISIRGAIQLLLILSITGCATSVRYAPRVPGVTPGYVDQRLGENTYQVKIGEAWPKDWHDLEKFAMYRAAEVTRKNGKRYFVVLDASSRVNSYTISLPSTTTTTTGTVNAVGSTAYINTRSTTTGRGAANISGGWYTLDFMLIPDADVNKHEYVVDSSTIINNIKYFIDSRR